MGRRMTEQDWTVVDATEVYDHATAHTIAEEYTWGWASCWFASTGEFAHEIMSPRDGRYATAMDRALFGWWADMPEHAPSSREQRTRARMLAYLTDREARDDMGPVDGFEYLWVGQRATA